MFAPLEHEEDGAENFVADGDDGALVATPNDERLELGLEDGCRSAGGMSELAKQATDVEVALAKLAGLALAGRLVVARADADPERAAWLPPCRLARRSSRVAWLRPARHPVARRNSSPSCAAAPCLQSASWRC